MIKKRHFIVDWDTDGAPLKECGLPKKVAVPGSVPDGQIADWLSDRYGYCIFSLVEIA